LRAKNRPSVAIQVTKNLNSQNEDREIQGLLTALNKFKLKEGIIITDEQEETRKIDGKSIKIIPVWKWLLEN
jgi:predicted AAA+ superfamily ATPase